MKNKLLRNLSANTVQLVVNQLLGLVIFYLLSTGLDKTNFGQLNLALAILLVSFNLLSLGIDQVAIRRIASGHPPQSVLQLYLFHVLLTGLLFYALLFGGSLLIKLQSGLYPLLLLIGLGKLMIYFSTPFKQASSGLEQFKPLAVMLVISNLVRSAGLVVLTLLHVLSLQTTIIIFIAGDAFELALCIYLFKKTAKMPITFGWHKAAYIQLLREALPQTGVVLITSALARFDWIFIGFLVSAAKLAEYSFAYKVFEMATLPLLAIAPLLIPWFTRLFKQQQVNASNLKLLLRAELLVAAFTIVVLNMLWAPVVDVVTAGKYGAVNTHTIFILTLCIPFLYLNNFLWTIYFAQSRMKMILTGFIITFLVNVVLDIVLIPIYKNEGAAIAFLAATIVQSIFYLSKNALPGLTAIWLNLFACLFCAVLSILLVQKYFAGGYAGAVFASILFLLLLVVTTQLRPADYKAIRKIFN